MTVPSDTGLRPEVPPDTGPPPEAPPDTGPPPEAPPDASLRPQVLEQMYALLPQVLRREEIPDLAEQTRLMEDLGLTSSTTLELMLELEERLAVQINVEEIEQDDVATVGALADYIAGHLLSDE